MNFIVAVDNNWAIGKKGGLIYNLPSDLAYFKKMTSGKVVVMGERTYLSLPKKPLPNRTNIVLSADGNKYDGAICVSSLDELSAELKKYDTENVFVIGGASVYNLLMDNCRLAYITKINAEKPADTYINNLDKKPNWRLAAQSQVFEENGLNFTFCVYENKKVTKF
ncbi:MAG: dihydrofolate reductase [Clostridia bacterium]|nr:dihydrofolate reductase [Clostridia bacterium]